MAVKLDAGRIVLSQVVAVEEAETLLGLLQAQPGASVDAADCEHLHAAALQVLLAARAPLCALPQDPSLARWLRQSLPTVE